MILYSIADNAFSESLWDIWLQPQLTKFKVNKKYNYNKIYTYTKYKFLTHDTYKDLGKTICLYQDLLNIEHGVSNINGVYRGS